MELLQEDHKFEVYLGYVASSISVLVTTTKKNCFKLKEKGERENVAQWQNTCTAFIKLWSQFIVLPKKKSNSKKPKKDAFSGYKSNFPDSRLK